MFSHVMFGTQNLTTTAAFYDALLAPLGLKRLPVRPENAEVLASWNDPARRSPSFFICVPLNEQPATVGNGGMVAFLADSSGQVDAAYAAGMKTGGRDEGAPGPRPQYGDGYYGAYLRDPDGNKVHVVFRGDLAD